MRPPRDLYSTGEHAARPEGDDGVGLCVEASRLKGAAVRIRGEELALVCGRKGTRQQDGSSSLLTASAGKNTASTPMPSMSACPVERPCLTMKGSVLRNSHSGMGGHDGHGGDGRGFGSRLKAGSGLGAGSGSGFGLGASTATSGSRLGSGAASLRAAAFGTFTRSV